MKKTIAIMMATALITLPMFVKAELVVIVSSKSPVSALTKDQAQKIFMGKINSFPDGSAAVPIDLPDGPDKEAFYQQVASKGSAQMKAYWAKIGFTGKGQPPREVGSVKEMVQLIGKNPNMVGYVDKASADSSVKAILTLQ